MKRILATFLALAMVFALAGFGGAVLADGTHEDAGYYNLASMTEDGETIDGALLALFGMSGYLELREDGTGTMSMYGEAHELEWEDGALIAEGETAYYTREGDVLTIEPAEGVSMVFEKGEPAAASAEPEPAEEVSDTLPGTYKLSGLISDGEETSAEEIAMMEQLGLSYSLVLFEDGTGSLVIFGQGLDLTWDESAFTVEGFALDESESGESEAIPYTHDGIDIIIDIEGATITFTKSSDTPKEPENSLNLEDALTAIFGGMMASDEPGEEPTEEPGEEPAEEPSDEPAEEGEYYAEPLAEGDIGDCHVAIVGAEAFTDSDGKDAIRFFYEFTNNTDESTSAWWELTYLAEQDEYELVTTYAPYGEYSPEDDNADLKVLPGAMILCVKEYKFKPSGAPVTFTLSNWYGDEVSYTFEDAANLPGRPMEWKPVKVADPQTYIDYPLSGETDNIAVNITDAEIVEGKDTDVIRVYFEVTNKTEEAKSAMWLVNYYAFQDNVQLTTDYYADSVDSDNAIYDEIAPGDTMLVSETWELRTDSPVEIVLMDYTNYSSEVIAAATVSLSE